MQTPTPTPTPAPTPILSTPKFLYAFGDSTKKIYGFSVNASTGALTSLGSPWASGSEQFSRLCGNGSLLYVTGGADLNGFTINQATGALTHIAGLPITTLNFATDCALTPNGAFLFVTGYRPSQIYAYAVGSGGALTAVSSPFQEAVNTNPSGFAIDATGKYLFVALNGSNEVDVFTFDAFGLTRAAGAPHSTGGMSPDYVAVNPSGKFVFVEDKSSNDVAVFALNAGTGALTALANLPFSTGATTNPEQIAIDAQGKFLYMPGNTSSNIAGFSIDGSTGALTALSGFPFGTGLSNPTASVIDPSNKFYYVADENVPGNIHVFDFNATTGALTAASPASTNVGEAVSAMAITH